MVALRVVVIMSWGGAVSFRGEKCWKARPQAEFRLELARDACRGSS